MWLLVAQLKGLCDCLLKCSCFTQSHFLSVYSQILLKLLRLFSGSIRNCLCTLTLMCSIHKANICRTILFTVTGKDVAMSIVVGPWGYGSMAPWNPGGQPWPPARGYFVSLYPLFLLKSDSWSALCCWSPSCCPWIQDFLMPGSPTLPVCQALCEDTGYLM